MRLYDSSAEAARGLAPERLDPAELAELWWDMYERRDRVEEVVGSLV